MAITMSDILASIRTIETQQVAFDALFAGHPMLKIVYEDFAERPVRVAERAAQFFGFCHHPPNRQRLSMGRRVR